MRHRNLSSYSYCSGCHGPVLKPYLWKEWTFSRHGAKYRIAQVLQYLVEHPGISRRELHEAVFNQKFSPGQHSNFYSNALWHDLIDYDKKFKYYATSKGLEFLKKSYVSDLAKLFNAKLSSIEKVLAS